MLKIIPLQWRLNSHSVFVSLIPYCLFWSCGLPALLLSAVTAVCVCVFDAESERASERERERTSEKRVSLCITYCYSMSCTHTKDKSLSDHMQIKGSDRCRVQRGTIKVHACVLTTAPLCLPCLWDCNMMNISSLTACWKPTHQWWCRQQPPKSK